MDPTKAESECERVMLEEMEDNRFRHGKHLRASENIIQTRYRDVVCRFSMAFVLIEHVYYAYMTMRIRP